MSKAVAVAKTNFKHLKVAYLVTFICLATILVDITLSIIFGWIGEDSGKVALENYFYILVILAPILIVSKNFRRIMNLGCKKKDFYMGCLINYGVFAAVVSLINVLGYSLLGPILSQKFGLVNLIEVFGWTNNGVVLAFLQQFAFIVLLQIFLHTLTSIQDSWIGWAIDIIIIAIISVFTPIAPLRALEVKFFNMIIFSAPFIQILSCLVLSAVLYGLYRIVLNRKTI